MKDFVFQNRLSDCGFCALKIALTDYTNNRAYLKLRKKKKRGNYSFLDLITIAKQQGYLLKGYQIPIHQLPPIKSIVLFLKRGSFHYVYVKSINEKYLWIYDPIQGKRKMGYQQFYQQFTGYYLTIIKRIKDVKIKTCIFGKVPYFIFYGIFFIILGLILFLLD